MNATSSFAPSQAPGLRPGRQRGTTLIVAMLLLLLMSAVSLTTLKAIKTDERLASNLQDRYLAFQAAESALREAEVLLAQGNLAALSAATGYYLLDAAQVPHPFDFTSGNARIYAGGTECESASDEGCRAATLADPQPRRLIGVAQPPRYIVEAMEAGVEQGGSLHIGVSYGNERRVSYRITALGFGRSATTRVVLQTTYRR